MITLTVNGEKKEVDRGCTLSGLIGMLGIDPDAVVIEYNRLIIGKEKLDQTICQDNDQIEIAQFMGGG